MPISWSEGLADGFGHRPRHIGQAKLGIELPQPVGAAGFELAKERDQLALLLQLELGPDMADEATRHWR